MGTALLTTGYFSTLAHMMSWRAITTLTGSVGGSISTLEMLVFQ
jgi:hypothetical protein